MNRKAQPHLLLAELLAELGFCLKSGGKHEEFQANKEFWIDGAGEIDEAGVWQGSMASLILWLPLVVQASVDLALVWKIPLDVQDF